VLAWRGSSARWRGVHAMESGQFGVAERSGVSEMRGALTRGSRGGRGGVVGLGIADGVYMWKTQGIDAGLFSRALMDTARREVEGGAADALAGAAAARPGHAGGSPVPWQLLGLACGPARMKQC
jgi:hypothetical protein